MVNTGFVFDDELWEELTEGMDPKSLRPEFEDGGPKFASLFPKPKQP